MRKCFMRPHAHFASAAIDIAAAGGKGSKNDKAKTNVGAIAGGVVGGVLGAAVIVVLVFYLVRRKRKAARRPYVSHA